MPTTNLFSKVGAWFKAGATKRRYGAELANVDHNGLLKPPTDNDDRNTAGTLLSRRQERTQSLQKLEDGYQRLSELVGSIQKHLDTQDERSRKIGEGLARLTDPITRLPESVDRQHEQLRAIVEQLETANARSGRIESSMAELPKIADAQRETLVAVRDEMDGARKTQERIADSMDGFRDAVGSLNRAADASVASLRELQSATAAGDERLALLLTEQNKKTTTLVIVAIAMAAVLTIATIASMFVGG